MDNNSRPITNCQICGSLDLVPKLFLGNLPLVNGLQRVDASVDKNIVYPLELVRCGQCGLVQINYQVDPHELFPPEYPYVSGTTRVLRENFGTLPAAIDKFKRLDESSLVVDIGSNDGTLLSNFKNRGLKVLGIEPTGAGDLAQEKGIETHRAFFSEKTADEVLGRYGAATVVTAANVFAHIPDLDDVMKGLSKLLSDDGIFVSENHYFAGALESLQYDTIYHEHLRYYTLSTLVELMRRNGFFVFHVERIPTHGGSIRVFATRRSNAAQVEIQPSVKEMLGAESDAGITDGSIFEDFVSRVFKSKYQLLKIMLSLKAGGQHVVGIGAPSRASTLVSFTGLDHTFIDAVAEMPTSPKVDHFLPGTRIPIYDEDRIVMSRPDVALIFSWHIADDIMPILRKKGFQGKFLIPLPSPALIS